MGINPGPIERSKDVLGGTPVFAGTRVAVRTLIDYLEAGDALDDFLADFPTVTRDQAAAVLELARDALGVIALKAHSNRIEDLRPLMPRVRQLLATIGPGRWERVGE
jgi:uncharacterized protein (DUF433 family)